MCITCPECEKSTKSDSSWLKEIIDINENMVIKSDDGDVRVAVLSRCPFCGALSWSHYRKEFLNNIKNGKINLQDHINWREEEIPFLED
jgi:hypothetical protein